jgi:hypothetical protein
VFEAALPRGAGARNPWRLRKLGLPPGGHPPGGVRMARPSSCRLGWRVLLPRCPRSGGRSAGWRSLPRLTLPDGDDAHPFWSCCGGRAVRTACWHRWASSAVRARRGGRSRPPPGYNSFGSRFLPVLAILAWRPGVQITGSTLAAVVSPASCLPWLACRRGVETDAVLPRRAVATVRRNPAALIAGLYRGSGIPVHRRASLLWCYR